MHRFEGWQISSHLPSGNPLPNGKSRQASRPPARPSQPEPPSRQWVSAKSDLRVITPYPNDPESLLHVERVTNKRPTPPQRTSDSSPSSQGRPHWAETRVQFRQAPDSRRYPCEGTTGGPSSQR